MGKAKKDEAADVADVEAEDTAEVEVEAEAPKTKKKCTGVTQDAKIEILVESNPKRSGSASYDRFEGYLTDPAPATVKDALENGLIMGDIHYDFIHGSISVEGATVEEYTPSTRGPNAPSEVSDEEVEVGDEEEVF